MAVESDGNGLKKLGFPNKYPKSESPQVIAPAVTSAADKYIPNAP